MNNLQPTISPLQRDPAFDLLFRLRQPVPARPKACVLLLHGVGGSEMNLAELAGAIDPDTLVVLPRGPLEFAPGQFGWFRVAFTASGPSIVAAEAEQSRQAVIRFIGQLQAAYGIDPKKTVVAGFSQGGIVSASVALSAPEQVGGFAVLSGRILPELEPHIASRERLSTLRGFIAHGEFDNKLPMTWAQRADSWLTELGIAHETRLYPMGHEISAAVASDFLHWLGEQTPITRLHIGTDQTTVATANGTQGGAPLTLALGAQKTAADFFKHAPPTPLEMEDAIMAVEDEVSRARTWIAQGSVLYTTDPVVREIALMAGVTEQPELTLSVEAVEETFQRLAAVTLGRPASSEAMPTDAAFAATLLILREFMHHLQFASITVKT
ncbi:alpha/beta hydrolase-fold protein [Rhodoferax ferrireducens]|uniref:alpha/beta hydrolase-fold protein n=1 Tax=Rhodoferax ferrireducens TaxID=192843 RepID=UPI000E0CE858